MFWMMNGASFGWVWALVGVLWMLLFWGAIIGLIVWGINKLTSAGKSQVEGNPLNIVKARYARGEITKEQFQQLKQDLS